LLSPKRQMSTTSTTQPDGRADRLLDEATGGAPTTRPQQRSRRPSLPLVAAYIVFAVLLFYASGGTLFIASILQQTGHLPTDRAWLTVLFPNGFGNFDPDESGHVELVKQDYLTLAMPWFVLCLVWEALLVCRWMPPEKRPLHTYSFNDTIMSISTGVLYILVSKIVLLNWGSALYELIWDNARVTSAFSDVEDPLAWWVSFFLADFFYYVYHRASHWFSWLWASHLVHHCGEEYNLSTALRQPATDFLTPTRFLSSLPLAFFVPAPLTTFQAQLGLLYQFWIHTQVVPPLPLIEYVINTSSLHKIHHARNAHLLGKNYGAVLSVWDWLGGTLEFEHLEGEPIYFGIVPPLKSWSVVWANFCHFHYMATVQRRWHGLASPFVHWTPPGGRCPKLGMRLNPEAKFETPAFSLSFRIFIAFEFVSVVLFGIYISYINTSTWSFGEKSGFYAASFAFALAAFSCMGLLQSVEGIHTARRALQVHRAWSLFLLLAGLAAFLWAWLADQIETRRVFMRDSIVVMFYACFCLSCLVWLQLSLRSKARPEARDLVCEEQPSVQGLSA